ncbi:hypothetical protein RclHR1_02830014 [Rhizophagus clarus]|uniref:Uncharacterized protein n=1 Tax=Rhizophagus clarus TaxID=94130 RepID=A0A2Z6RY25_9GLOM|nr:hypothetical protein RclHR1_02830014 [Rhizophagus clarus]
MERVLLGVLHLFFVPLCFPAYVDPISCLVNYLKMQKKLIPNDCWHILLRTCLSKTFSAYPTLGYRVLPEGKERDEGGQRRQRLDILVRNKDLPVYGFELFVATSETMFDDHLKRSDYYSRIHNCNKTYTIDISPSEKLAKYFGNQEYEKVIPVHMIYNRGDGKAKLVYGIGNEKEVSIIGSKWQMMWC